MIKYNNIRVPKSLTEDKQMIMTIAYDDSIKFLPKEERMKLWNIAYMRGLKKCIELLNDKP